MDTATVTPEQTEAMTGLVSRMQGKSQPEMLNMLKAYADEHGAKEERMAPIAMLSDEQIKLMVREGADVTKKMVAEETAKIERKYAIPQGEARAIVEDQASKDINRESRRFEDCKEAAKVFRAIARASTGHAQHGELAAAREAEAQYLRSTGREVRNMDVGTGSEGGYLSPEIWNTMMYENLARTSLLRQHAYWFPMESNIMRLPKITANVTGSTTAELSAATPSQPTIAQATWTLKKLTVLTNPFSIELFENARPELVQMLTNVATVEMNRKEDEVCFNTTDSAWSDLLDVTTNRVYLGGSSTSGKTVDTTATFDDMSAMIYQLAEQYVPDEDVSGSGIVGGGEAQFWVNKSLIQTLLKLKGTTNQYIWGNVQDLQSGRKIFGHPVRRVLSMPSSATASTQFAAFGNLKYRWVGYKTGFVIDMLREGVVNNVNLATTSSYALRVNELLDIQTIDDSAFSRLSTSAS